VISLVVAYAKSRVIGRDNELPWYIPDDLKHFKRLTTGKTVVMGRNTYESIVRRLGKPLPNRRNIVVSGSLKEPIEGVEVAVSLEDALNLAKNDKETVLIGGQRIFEEAINKDMVERIYATEIDADVQGDTFFPELDPGHWTIKSTENHANPEYKYSFVTYERSA